MTNASPSIEEQRLAIKRERLALRRDRLAFETKQASTGSLLQSHLGAVITGVVTLLAATFTIPQVWVAHLAKQSELEITRLQNDEEMDRRWKTEMLGFLERHAKEIYSLDTSVSKPVVELFELSFPPKYVQPVLVRLSLIQPADSASPDQIILDSLLNPLVVQFDRTKKAFDEYVTGSFSAELELQRGNETARDLLVRKRDLIPEKLREDAARLVQHYDAWLQEYARLRGVRNPDLNVPVFAGPLGFPFPRESEQRFREEASRMRAGAAAAGRP